MAGSSTGSNTAFGLILVCIALLVLLLQRHYLPLRSTPAYILLPVFLSIALPASIVVLVPVDLASSSVVEKDGSARGIWLPEGTLLVAWRITYWLTFVLTWLVLPLLGEYADSGDRDPYRKMLYSIRSNAKFQAIVLLCSGAGLAYFFITSGVTFMSLKSLIMSLAYAWGLILAIYLMGHGLVSIPRKLYKSVRVSSQLRQVQINAFRIHERFNEAIEELNDLEGQVWKLHQRKTGTALDFQNWIEELFMSCDLPEARMPASNSSRYADSNVPAVITERYLADLTRKLKRARHKKIRFAEGWSRVVNEARDCQDILDSAGSRRLEFKRASPAAIPFLANISLLNQRTRYHLYAHILPITRFILSIVFAIASISIVWSEVFRAFYSKLSIVGISLIHHPNSRSDGKIGLGGQFMAAAWLLYMSTAALTSVTEVKVWGNRALVTRHTYAESACWYASLVARLTIPLAYNFTTQVPGGISEETVFYRVLGRSIDLTALGTGFSDYFPIFILIPVLATSFNLYSKVKNLAGFGAFEDETDDDPNGFGTGGWREGRALIEREWNGSHGNMNNSLGLTTRDHSPSPQGARSPINPPDRYTDTLSPPPNPQTSRALGSTSSSSHLPQTNHQRLNTPQQERSSASSSPVRRPTIPSAPSSRQNQPYTDEPGTGGFFGDFAHRVKNTFETAEPPDWIANIKKPKWMSGDRNASASSGGNSASGSGSPSGITGGINRFFSEGGLRL